MVARPLLGIVLLTPALASAAGLGDWPQWRGPNGQGRSDATGLPIHWTSTENVRWKVAVPGEGNSSPIVCGDRVLVTAAGQGGDRRMLLCYRRTDGTLLWQADAPRGPKETTYEKCGYAASTPATDGARVYCFFGSAGVTAFSLTGQLVWHRDLGPFEVQWGMAASPVVVGDTVVLNCDHDAGSFLIALDRRTGRTVWKTDRPGQDTSWSTPVLAADAESHRRELIVDGSRWVRAYDPAGGRLLWSCGGMTEVVIPTPVLAGPLIIAASGKKGRIMAIRPGGSGDVTASRVAWQTTKATPYVPSPLVVGDRFYALADGGVLRCLRASDGSLVYQARIGGTYSASLVAAGSTIYALNEAGTTTVFDAGPRFQVAARNPIGESCLSTPALAGGAILIRSKTHLYSIEPAQSPTR